MATFVPIRGTQAQINATPIVDGQMLIETDQGNFNKIYLDVNTTRYQVGGHSGGSGSSFVLTTTETSLYGKSVTITIDGTTYTDTFNSSGTVVINDVVKVGTAVVTSTDGSQTATSTLLVPYYGLYTVNLSFFNATITVTFPYSLGALCTLSDGTTTIPATSSPMIFNVNHTGTWRANVTLDGASKYVDTVITTDGQTETVDIEYGTINLTFADDFRGQSITCTKGSTVITKSAPSSGNSMRFFPPTTGTWTIASTVGGQTYSKTVDVNDLNVPVPAELVVRPNGSTVTPVNDVSIWLQCASIDKPYTTLEEVLSDEITLAKLISEPNAVDYMVRSTEWANNGLIPNMTSPNTPSGNVTASTQQTSYEAWKAFDGEEYSSTNSSATRWSTQNGATGQGSWIQYEFDTAVVARAARIHPYLTGTGNNLGNTLKSYQIQASNDNFITSPIILSEQTCANADTDDYIIFDNDTAYKYYRLYATTNSYYSSGTINLINFQLYPLKFGITDDDTTMRYIGKRNYCANTLLANTDWREAICNSNYLENVLNIKVPTMTSNTTPSGEASASSDYGSGYEAYRAFDNNDSTSWNGTTTTDYIQYEFVSAVAVRKVVLKIIEANKIGTFKILASNDNFVNDTHDLTNVITPTSLNVDINFNNSDNYKYYRYQQISVTGGSISCGLTSLQFYGRKDVDESVIDIYSAAQDSVYYMNGVNQVPIGGTTDGNGHTTVARSNLPINGEYTLYSTVAKNPLDLSSPYQKRIKIFDEIIDISVMPRNTVYWNGYKKNYSSFPNGYYYSGFTMDAGTFSSTYIDNPVPSAATGAVRGEGTDYPINYISNMNVVAEGTRANTGGDCGSALSLANKNINASMQLKRDNLGTGYTIVAIPSPADVKLYVQGTTPSSTYYQNIKHIMSWSTTHSSQGSTANKVYNVWADRLNQIPTFISAANDTLYLLDGSNNQIPIATTNAMGYSYDLMLENGTYDIYSSVAKDPSDLSKPFCLRNFVVDNDTVQIKVMPDGNVIYWYGYQNNIEAVSTDNGWSGHSYTAPIFNTNYIHVANTTTNYISAIGTKEKIDLSRYTTLHGIAKGNSGSNNVYGTFFRVYNTDSSEKKTVGQQNVVEGISVDDLSVKKYDYTLSASEKALPQSYMILNYGAVRDNDVYAIWFEV